MFTLDDLCMISQFSIIWFDHAHNIEKQLFVSLDSEMKPVKDINLNKFSAENVSTC